ncbi:HAD family hydrolase [Streptomyces boninensis]|uniref:HAD family hydrolase n=1 Tax=Streptomyces boninensis TaxID=2039455 RepID=UPI003B21AF32
MQHFALFDLDNTLIDRQAALKVWARTFAVTRGLPGAERLIREALHSRAYPRDFEWLRAALDVRESAAELWSEYAAGVADNAACSPGVRRGLGELRAAGWTLGIATNGATDIQRAKIDRTGLAGLVDGVCVSEEVGEVKPAAVVFEVAAKRCGVELNGGGWMVGDNAATDIAGGRDVGLRTLWIAAGRPWPTDDTRPDLVAEDASAATARLLALDYSERS